MEFSDGFWAALGALAAYGLTGLACLMAITPIAGLAFIVIYLNEGRKEKRAAPRRAG